MLIRETWRSSRTNCIAWIESPEREINCRYESRGAVMILNQYKYPTYLQYQIGATNAFLCRAVVYEWAPVQKMSRAGIVDNPNPKR